VKFLCLDRVLDRLTGLATESDFYRAVVEDKEATFWTVVDKLASHTTRHMKAQSIGGSNALSLPPTTTKIVTMRMSKKERGNYNTAYAHARKHMVKLRAKEKTSAFQLEQILVHPTGSKLFTTWSESTKIRVLMENVAAIKLGDPLLRIVVFTQYTHTHEAVVRALTPRLTAVYKITGSASATERDFALRCFQTAGYSAAIVVMLKAGSVGMSLHQGSHLFLMEPCLDPTAEKQAFGRINRLGQKKSVMVKKFVFEDSIEANVVALHEKMRTGTIKGQGNSFSKEAIEILCSTEAE